MLTAFFVVMLLFAAVLLQAPRSQRQATERAAPAMDTERTLGAFFWILVIGSGLAIMIHYLRQVPWLREVFYGTSSRG